MNGIYPAFLGVCTTGIPGECQEPEIIYIEVPGDGGCYTRQIVVKATILLSDKYIKKRKKIKIKAKIL